MRQWLGRGKGQRCQDGTSTVCSCCSRVTTCYRLGCLRVVMPLLLLPCLLICLSITNAPRSSSLASVCTFLPSCFSSLSLHQRSFLQSMAVKTVKTRVPQLVDMQRIRDFEALNWVTILSPQSSEIIIDERAGG